MARFPRLATCFALIGVIGTIRNLREEYNAPTCIRESWLAQLVASGIYVGFALVAP